MYAVISDIHANQPALEAVLRDIDAQKIQDVICLGDVVGYGPDPLQCVDLIQERCSLTVMGNHEEALVKEAAAWGFHAVARSAITWTRDQMEPGFFSGPIVRRRWEFVRDLPLRAERGPDVFVHGSPRDPTTEYLLANEVAWNPAKYEEVLEATDRFLFVGHTHLPCVIDQGLTVQSLDELGGVYRRPAGQRAIVNVGSVGQPRDRDPRACYAVVDGDQVTWRRVSYDVPATVARIQGIDELDDRLAKRLEAGT